MPVSSVQRSLIFQSRSIEIMCKVNTTRGIVKNVRTADQQRTLRHKGSFISKLLQASLLLEFGYEAFYKIPICRGEAARGRRSGCGHVCAAIADRRGDPAHLGHLRLELLDPRLGALEKFLVDDRRRREQCNLR